MLPGEDPLGSLSGQMPLSWSQRYVNHFLMFCHNKLSIELLQGPDGGWGWVVVAASFICLCVLDGAAYTFGIFLDPLIEEMGGGRGQTSLAGTHGHVKAPSRDAQRCRERVSVCRRMCV